MERNIKSNSKFYLEKEYLIVIIGALVLISFSMILIKTAENFINLKALLLLVGLIALSSKLYKNHESSFIIGSSMILVGLSIVNIIGSFDNFDNLKVAIYSSMMIVVYAIVYIYFILNIYKISKTPYESKQIKDLNKYIYYITLIAIIILFILSIFPSSIGVGSFIDVPSIIGVGGTVLLPYFLVKDRVKSLYIMQNNAIGYVILMIFTSSLSLLINYNDIKICGSIFSMQLLSNILVLLLYLTLIKPEMITYNIENSKNENILYLSIVVSMIIFAIFFTLILS